jgi:hypothetical protein
MSEQSVRDINGSEFWSEGEGWINETLSYFGCENSFYVNEPFFKEYWDEDPKIVFCNLNGHGYLPPNNPERFILTWEIFEQWISNLTIKNSTLFVYALQKRLCGEIVTVDELKQIQGEILKTAMKRITYMNLIKEIRDEWNTQTKEVEQELEHFYSFKHNRKNHRDLIEDLETDIFIVTGEPGCETINKIYQEQDNQFHLPWKGMTVCQNGNKKMLMVSLYHPASSVYGNYFTKEYIVETVEKIVTYLKG